MCLFCRLGLILFQDLIKARLKLTFVHFSDSIQKMFFKSCFHENRNYLCCCEHFMYFVNPVFKLKKGEGGLFINIEILEIDLLYIEIYT